MDIWSMHFSSYWLTINNSFFPCWACPLTKKNLYLCVIYNASQCTLIPLVITFILTLHAWEYNIYIQLTNLSPSLFLPFLGIQYVIFAYRWRQYYVFLYISSTIRLNYWTMIIHFVTNRSRSLQNWTFLILNVIIITMTIKRLKKIWISV